MVQARQRLGFTNTTGVHIMCQHIIIFTYVYATPPATMQYIAFVGKAVARSSIQIKQVHPIPIHEKWKTLVQETYNRYTNLPRYIVNENLGLCFHRGKIASTNIPPTLHVQINVNSFNQCTGCIIIRNGVYDPAMSI